MHLLGRLILGRFCRCDDVTVYSTSLSVASSLVIWRLGVYDIIGRSNPFTTSVAELPRMPSPAVDRFGFSHIVFKVCF